MKESDVKRNISKNLTRYMEEKGINNRELADILGVSESTVGKWLLEKSIPRMGVIESMANYFGIEKSDLIEEQINLENIPGIKLVKNLINVPILGSVACGIPTMTEENFEGYFKLDPDLAKPDFSLYAEGDSMIDANIRDGDIVFFKQTPDVESGSIACVLLDDKVTLKKVIKTDDALILQPQNDAYKPIIIKENDYSTIKILGEMIGVYSKRNK